MPRFHLPLSSSNHSNSNGHSSPCTRHIPRWSLSESRHAHLTLRQPLICLQPCSDKWRKFLNIVIFAAKCECALITIAFSTPAATAAAIAATGFGVSAIQLAPLSTALCSTAAEPHAIPRHSVASGPPVPVDIQSPIITHGGQLLRPFSAYFIVDLSIIRFYFCYNRTSNSYTPGTQAAIPSGPQAPPGFVCIHRRPSGKQPHGSYR